MPNTPQRRGLELLIRRRPEKGGPSGFELKVLDRDEVFLRLKPKRTGAVKVEQNTLFEAEGKVYVVRFAMHDTERYVRLTEREYFLFQRMDGVHTILELATAYVMEFGTLDVDDVRHFLNRARKLKLIEFRRNSLLRSRDDRHGWLRRLCERLSWRWSEIDSRFERLYRLFRPLLSQWMLPVYGGVVVAGLVRYAQLRWTGGLADPRSAWLWLAVGACWFPALVVLHEVAHGLACKAVGRRIKAVGFTLLDHLVPSFYVDVTDTLMATPLQRAAVTLAGPAANLVLGAVATLLAAHLPQGAWSWPLMVLADVNFLLAAYTLWPFHPVREDGYLVLTDLVRVPALRGRSFQALFRRTDDAGPAASPRVKRAYVLYLVGLLLTVLAALALGAWLLFGVPGTG